MKRAARNILGGVLAIMLAGQAVSAAAQNTREASATWDLKECISDEGNFVEEKGAALFVIRINSTCPVKLRCRVNAYIVTAMGPTTAQATLNLPAGAKGQPMSRVHRIKIKQASGSANTSRNCTAI